MATFYAMTDFAAIHPCADAMQSVQRVERYPIPVRSIMLGGSGYLLVPLSATIYSVKLSHL
jgi:hypothetical protein